MALTVDEIAEILNAMRVENEHNVESFEKVLTGINAKLEIMSEDSEATDLIKLYISELKKAVEDRHSSTIDRFNSLESSFKNLLSSQDELVKTSELTDLFHVLSSNFDNFSSEVSGQKNALQQLDDKLSLINDKTFNKDELAALISDFSLNLSDMNANFERSFENIETSLAEAVSIIKKSDASAQVNLLREEIQSLSSDVSAIPSKISFENLEDKISYFQNLVDTIKTVVADTSVQSTGIISDKFKSLENSFENIVTDSDFAGFKSDLADFVQKIIDNSSALNSSLSYSTERIENILAALNTLDYRDDFGAINGKFKELENAVNNLTGSSSSELEKIELRLAEILSDEDFTIFKKEITDYVQRIIDNTTIINNDLIYNREQAENIVKSINSLDYKSDFDGISAKISELEDVLKSISQSSNYEFQNLERTLASIVTDSDFAGFKAELADFVQKIIDNSSALNKDLAYSTERIESILSTINSLDYKNDFDVISEKINELENALKDVSQSNNAEFKNLSSKLASAVNDFEFENFKSELSSLVQNVIENSVSLNKDVAHTSEQVENILASINSLDYKSDFENIEQKVKELENIINSVSDTNAYEFSNLSKTLSSIVTDADFAGFKSDLADFVQKIIDNSSSLNNELSYSTERIESILTTVNSMDYRTDFEGIVSKISELKSVVDENLLNTGTINSSLAHYSDNVLEQISELEKTLLNVSTNEGLSAFRQDLTELIERIYSETSSLNSELSYGVQRIENIYDAVNSKSFKDDLTEVEEKVDELKDLVNLVSSDNSAEFENIQKTLSNIVTDADFSGFKSDLADFVQKIIDNSTALNSELSYSTERIENILTTVKALDFRDDFENIILRINDIKEVFDEGSKINYTNLSTEISDLSEKINNSFSNMDEKRQEVYGDLKNELGEILLNLHNLTEASPQKSIDELAGLTAQISENISALRNGIGADIQEDYGDLKASLNAVIANLQIVKEDILAKNDISSDLSVQNFEKLENQLAEQFKAFNELQTSIAESDKLETSHVLEALDKTTVEITDLIEGIKENDNSNYEAVKEYIEELAAGVNNLQSEFNTISEQNISKVASDINGISDTVALFREEFKQSVESNLENSAKIIDSVSVLSERVNGMQEVLSGNSKDNLETLRNLLENLSQKLADDIERQKEAFSLANEEGDRKKFDALNNLSDDIKNIETLLNSSTEIFKTAVKENISEVKEYISEANNSIYQSQILSENKLAAKLEAIEVLYQEFEASVSGVNSGIQNILDNIVSLDASEQNDVIKDKLDNLASSSSLLISAVNDINRQNDELSNIISNILETACKKEDIIPVSDKIDTFASIMSSLKELISDTKEEIGLTFNQLFEKLETSFSTVVTEADFSDFRNNLSDFLQKILDNSNILNSDSAINREKIAEIADNISKLEPVDYSYDLEQISSKIDDLSELFENSSNNNFASLSDKIDEVKNEIINSNNSEFINNKFEDFSGIVTSVKDIILNSLRTNSDVIDEQFAKFEDIFSHLVSEEDFTNFRTDFADFIQKILDNATVLHVNSDANKEQLFEIAEKIKTFDYSQNFEDLSEKLCELKNSFENNSKTNYESIINEINNFKEELNNNITDADNNKKEKLESIGAELSDISLNVQFLRDFSSQKSSEILENISGELHSVIDDLKETINLGTRLDIEDLKSSIADITNEISTMKDDFIQKYDSGTFNVSSGFDNVKLSMENLVDAFSSFRDLLNEETSKNSESLISKMNEITFKVDELINEIHITSADYSDRVMSAVNEIASKLDVLSDGFTDEISENMSAFKETFSNLSENLQSMHAEFSQQLKDNHELQIFELKSISSNIGDFKSHISEAADSLRDYIAELNLAAKSAKSLSDSKFSEKLLDLEAAMMHSSDVYEQKMELLQSKLAEFAQIIEGSSSDTEAKIASSVEEITDVKGELTLLNDFLKAVKLSSDEKFTETVATVETGISSIINNLNDVNNAIINGIDVSVKENILSVEDKFDNLLEIIKEGHSNNLTGHIEEKISELKQEIGLINTDISVILQDKSDNILNSLDEVKTGIKEFSDVDFAGILAELKSQLEISFMNFSVDVNGELAASTEAVTRLEQAYKETFNRISVIEDCVNDKIQDSIELLNITVETSARDIKHSFEEKLDDYIGDLRAQLDVALNNTKTIDKIDGLKDELSVKIDAVMNEQASLAEKTDNINDIGNRLDQKLDVLVESTDAEEILNSLTEIEIKAQERGADLTEIINALSSKVDIIANDNGLKLAIGTVADKIDAVADNKTLDIALKMISEKIDVIAADSSAEDIQETLENSFNELNSKLDVISDDNSVEELSNNVKEAFDGLNSKIDIIAADASIDELHDKVDEISETEDKVAEMLSALHEKVDVLAMDGSEFDLEEEIDDIKDLIFEQRKYFEATSDEKAAAIDKYLRDVLLKLDNVDLEKNSEDIKECIMNALVSLFDQISFVEETEEIKDFVEEKTDEINQNLIEVQNQLRQIASSNDDFDYSYTLQDVETDIAKLRLAINNMSGNDFESLSDDIKKIVNSVEELESTLTQDQVVDLKGDIEKLNEDILSISSRTNKLLLTSDESYKALNDGLNNFSSLVYKLEDRINYLDNTEISERLERKIDNIHSMSVASANADKVFHQVMMYLGEWIDSTTENISSITEKTSEIAGIKDAINELKEAIPEKTSMLDEIENKFEQQELRIDRLEMKLEKILSALEEKDDMMLNRKVDKIEKLLSRLGTNIEKLTSYVDEE